MAVGIHSQCSPSKGGSGLGGPLILVMPVSRLHILRPTWKMKQQHNSRRCISESSFCLSFLFLACGYSTYASMNASQWHENWMSAQECHASEVGSKLSLCTKEKTCTLQHSNCRHLQLSKEQTVCTTHIINVSWILEFFFLWTFSEQKHGISNNGHCFVENCTQTTQVIWTTFYVLNYFVLHRSRISSDLVLSRMSIHLSMLSILKACTQNNGNG